MHSCIRRSLHHFLLTLLAVVFTSFSVLGQSEPAAPAAEGVTAGASGDAALISAGEALFRNNCAQCHAMGEVIVGPALKDIHKKRSDAWLASWIRNSSKMIQSGDAEAVKIFNEYNKQQMPSFAFNDEEMKSLLAYMKDASNAPAAVAADKNPGNDQSGVAGQNVGTDAFGSAAGKYLNIILVVLVVVLIVIIITLLLISSLLNNYLKDKKGLSEEDSELLNQRVDLSKIYKSKAVRVIAGLILVVVILDMSIDKVMGIGIQQGYAPKQPIAFSHKIHAGDHQIDCNYCHTSVYKGRSANIPSANICMNCHSQIKKESPEIQKIYRAIEKNRPIEWVRIHNLPDLAYFNHAQHTNVGGIECQTCHGPIETMDVVYQYAPLTMGWCIDCHRNTPLNTEGNEYYDKLVELHDKANKGAAFTVVSNGGAECSKCHY